MGLYEDLQKDIGVALDTDLADATRILEFISVSDVYDPDTMKSTQVETSTPIRSTVVSDFEGERVDESTSYNNVEIIILDSDRGTFVFEKDMKIKDGVDEHKLIAFNSDPAKASWMIYARRLG